MWLKDLGTSARVGLAEAASVGSEGAERRRVVRRRVVEGHQQETLRSSTVIKSSHNCVIVVVSPLNPVPDVERIVTSMVPSFNSFVGKIGQL